MTKREEKANNEAKKKKWKKIWKFSARKSEDIKTGEKLNGRKCETSGKKGEDIRKELKRKKRKWIEKSIEIRNTYQNGMDVDEIK